VWFQYTVGTKKKSSVERGIGGDAHKSDGPLIPTLTSGDYFRRDNDPGGSKEKTPEHVRSKRGCAQ